MEESTKDLPAELGLNSVAQSIGNVGMRDGNTVNVGYFGSTQSSAPPGSSTLSGLFTPPRSATRHFIGRHELLTKLKDLLVHVGKPRKHGNEQTRIVITGIGGLGKSELCLKLAESVRHCFDHILWVDVDSLSSAQQGFTSISRSLGLSAQTLEEAVQNLGRIKQTWLLVLDNADDLDMDFYPLFPPGSDGVVLMTSRNPECGKAYGDTHWEQLDVLDEQLAIDLLLRRARIKPAPEQCEKAGEIVDRLGRHTLAVTLAGSYVAHRKCTLEGYLDVYESNWQRVMEHCPSQERSRYGQVMATFEASIRALEADESDEAHDVIDLLNVLSVLDANVMIAELCQQAFWGIGEVSPLEDPSATHIHCLTQRHVSMLPGFMRDQCKVKKWDSDRLVDACNRLEYMGLISIGNADSHGDTCLESTMHPLIHEWAWERQGQERKQASWIAAGSMLSLAWAFDRGYWRFFTPFERLWQKHKSAFKRKRWDLPISQVLFKFAQEFSMESEAALPCLDAIADQELDHGNLDSLDHVEFGVLWAKTRREVKDYDGCIHLMMQVLDLEKALPEDDVDRMQHQITFAEIYMKNGQSSRAVDLYEHLVHVTESHRAENDFFRLQSRGLLANAYFRSGQKSRGMRSLQNVVLTRKKYVRATQNLEGLGAAGLQAAVLNLCGMYKEQALFGKAITLLQDCVALSAPGHIRYKYCEWLIEIFMKTDQAAKADEVWRDMNDDEREYFAPSAGQDYESFKSKYVGSHD